MSNPLFRPLTAAVLTLAMLLGSHAASADDPQPANPPANAPAKAGQTLTGASLGTMLENMGYSFKTEKSTSGAELYYVTLTQDGITAEVLVSLSPSKSKVWTSVMLNNRLPKDGKFAVERLAKLLELNDQVGPSHFYIRKYSNSVCLYLVRPMDNREVTPALLRDLIQSTMNDCTRTKAHWMNVNWAEPSQSTAAVK